MTKSTINMYLAKAGRAYAADDCVTAQTNILQASEGARTFRGWGAAALRRRVATMYNRIAFRCAGGQGLLPPSGSSSRSDELLPPGGGSARNPDLLAPSFRGPLPTGSGWMPLAGFALAAVGVGIGVRALVKGRD